MLVHTAAYAAPRTSKAGSRTRRATALARPRRQRLLADGDAARRADDGTAAAAAIMTMTYLGGERAVPHYNVMGVAKAALDATVRYLARDLGPKNIRVNAISAGPVRTLAARSISGFPTMEVIAEERSPLRRNIDADDVGDAAAYLLSDVRAT